MVAVPWDMKLFLLLFLLFARICIPVEAQSTFVPTGYPTSSTDSYLYTTWDTSATVVYSYDSTTIFVAYSCAITVLSSSGSVVASYGDSGDCSTAGTSTSIGTFSAIIGMTGDSVGTVYIQEEGSYVIRKLAGAALSIYAGIAGTETTGGMSNNGDGGYATSATFSSGMKGIAADTVGGVYVCDSNAFIVRYISSGDIIDRVAGSGTSGDDDFGPATSADLGLMTGIWVSTAGGLYLLEYGAIRAVVDGELSTLFSTSTAQATFEAIAGDPLGNLYIADSGDGYTFFIKKLPKGATALENLGGNGMSSDPSGYASDLLLEVAASGVCASADLRVYVAAGTVVVLTSQNPTLMPSAAPVALPSAAPSSASTAVPTPAPSHAPTTAPSVSPSSSPSRAPTAAPSVPPPSASPTAYPTATSGNYVITMVSASSLPMTAMWMDSGSKLFFLADCKIYKYSSSYVQQAAYGTSTCSTAGTVATSATFNSPSDVWGDTGGSLFVAESDSYIVRRISSALVVSVYAGTTDTTATQGTAANGDGGAATSATFLSMYSAQGDSIGNLYITDRSAGKVRKVDSSGIISTYVGTGVNNPATAGPATSSSLYCPNRAWMDSSGALFISDEASPQIKKVSSSGILSILSASPGNMIYGLVGDSNGNLYFSVNAGYQIMKVQTSTGAMTTIAGTGTSGGSAVTVPGTSSTIYIVRAVFADTTGAIHYLEYQSAFVKMVLLDPTASPTVAPSQPTAIPTVAPTTLSPSVAPTALPTSLAPSTAPSVLPTVAPTEGPTSAYQLNNYILEGSLLRGLWRSPTGVVYVTGNGCYLYMYTSTYTLSQRFGSGSCSSTGSSLNSVALNSPVGIWGSSDGSVLYVTEPDSFIVRKIILSSADVSVFAGTSGSAASSGAASNGDTGPATSATFVSVKGVSGDSSGNIYVSDYNACKVRRIDSSGIISTFAGTGTDSYSATTGPATSSPLNKVIGLWVDSGGVVYIAEYNYLKKVTVSGIMYDLGVSSLVLPWLSGDSAGNVFIVNTAGSSSNIKRLSAAGILSTVSGSFSVDLYGCVVDSTGTVYTVDANGKLWVLSNIDPTPSPTTYMPTTALPSTSPTAAPTAAPTVPPTVAPSTASPTTAPSFAPSKAPTAFPTSTSGVYQLAQFNSLGASLQAIWADSVGNVFVARYGGGVCFIYKYTTAFALTATYGAGSCSTTGTVATNATFNNVFSIWGDTAGVLFVGEAGGRVVRKIAADLTVSVYAGTANTAGSSGTAANGDGGDATSATLLTPRHLSGDTNGNLLVSDTTGCKVRVVNSAGIISTFAGTGVCSFSSSSGPATSITLDGAYGAWKNSNGLVYVTDNTRLKTVSTSGILTDLGISTFIAPYGGLFGDAAGNVFITDSNNRVVRRYSTAGILSTIAGAYSPTSSFTNVIYGGCVDSNGVIYFTEGTATSENINRLVAIDPTATPTVVPSCAPSRVPTATPTTIPSTAPTSNPPTSEPSKTPTAAPTTTSFPTSTSGNYQLTTLSVTGGAGAQGIWGDSQGSLYVTRADTSCYVYKYTSSFALNVTYGTGTCSTSGTAVTSASFNNPLGLWGDIDGNLFVAESSSFIVRRIATAGALVSVYAGTQGVFGSDGDGGTATGALLTNPMAVTGDMFGKVYVADGSACRVRVVDGDGFINTFAGTGTCEGTTDSGPATSIPIDPAHSVWKSSSGLVYIADIGSMKVVDTAGILSDLGIASLNHPKIYGDLAGNVFVADSNNRVILKYTTSAGFTTIAGDSTSTGAFTRTPQGCYVDSSGVIYFPELETGNIVTLVNIDPTSTPTAAPTYTSTYTPTPRPTSVTGNYRLETHAGVGSVYSLWGNSLGELYVAKASTSVCAIYKYDASFAVTAYYGSGTCASYGTFASTEAAFDFPTSIWGDSDGSLYVLEIASAVIRRISSNLQITTIAGTTSSSGTVGETNGDGGPATSALLVNTAGSITGDSTGNLYFVETGSCKVRMVDTAGIISTVAGTGACESSASYVGNATSTPLNNPTIAWANSEGQLYIAEGGSGMLKVVTDGFITDLGLVSAFTDAHGLYGDAAGNLFIADTMASRILVYDGTGVSVVPGIYSTDRLYGLFVDSMGAIYTSEETSGLIDVLIPIDPTATPTLAPSSEPTITPTPRPTSTNGNYGLTTQAVPVNVFSVWGNSVGDLFLSQASETTCAIYNLSLPSFNHTATYGSGTCETAGSVAGLSAAFAYPTSIWGDSAGSLYVFELNSAIITKISIDLTMSTFAGTKASEGVAGEENGDGGPATSAKFVAYVNNLGGDSNGNVYVAETATCKVRKISSSGIISRVAGTSTCGSSTESGPATSSSLTSPMDVWVDSIGVLFIAEAQAGTLKIVTADGIMTDSGLTDAFGEPYGMFGDAAGNLFIADSYERAIRKYSGGGVVSTVEGTTNDYLYGMFVDSNGVLYTAGHLTGVLNVLTPIDPSMSPTMAPTASPTFAPSLAPTRAPSYSPTGTTGTYALSLLTTAEYYSTGLWIDISGTIVVTRVNTCYVYKYSSSFVKTATYGTGSCSSSGTTLTSATFNNPRGVWGNTAGDLYIVEYGAYVIRKISAATSAVSVYVGTNSSAGTSGTATNGDGGAATSALLVAPYGVTGDSNGNLFIVDYGACKVRKVDSSGIISTYAGTGVCSSTTSSGTATSTTLNQPKYVWLSSTGVLYIAESYVKKVDADGILSVVTTTASIKSLYGDNYGNLFMTQSEAVRRYSVDGIMAVIVGSGSNIPYDTSWGLENCFVSSTGTVYALDAGAGFLTITNIDPTAAPSKPPTIAPTMAPTRAPSYAPTGTTGTYALSTQTAEFYSTGLWIDSSGTIVITRTNTCYVYIYSSSFVKTATYGTGSCSSSGTTLTSATFNNPRGVWGNTAGDLYIVEYGAYVIRKISAATSAVSVYVGTTSSAGTSGTATNGDGGAATSALLVAPYGVTGDSNGNLFIVDYGTCKVRKVDSSGIISTYAGTGVCSSTTSSGTATSTTLNQPKYVWLSSTGVLYIAESYVKKVDADGILSVVTTTSSIKSLYGDNYGNLFMTEYNLVRRYSAAGIMSIIVGSGSPNPYVTSWGLENCFVSSTGTVYAVDTGAKFLTITNIDPTIAPTAAPTVLPSAAPSTTKAPTAYPTSTTGVYQATAHTGQGSYSKGLWADSSGNVYIARSAPGNCFIYQYSASFDAQTAIYGSGPCAVNSATTATSASFYTPIGIWGNTAGTLYLAEADGCAIMTISSSLVVSTLAGIRGTAATSATSANGDGGDATSATFIRPMYLTGDSNGSIYVADYSAHKVRRIDSSGIISTFAGTGVATDTTASGPATSITLSYPVSVWKSSTGDVYIGENNRLKVVSTSGIISDLGITSLSFPAGIYGDTASNIYIADSSNYLVRKYYTSTATLKTIAGTGTPSGSYTLPIYGSFVDTAGVVYFMDFNGIVNTLASIDPTIAPSIAPSTQPTTPPTRFPTVYPTSATGNYQLQTVITTSASVKGIWGQSNGYLFVLRGGAACYIYNYDPSFTLYDTFGTGTCSSTGTAKATATFNPTAIWGDASNSVIYVTEAASHIVRKISGSTISVYAGTSGTLSSQATATNGDGGAATSATLNNPAGLTGDTNGNIFVADSDNNKVRRVSSSGIISTYAGTGVGQYTTSTGVVTSTTLSAPTAVWVSSTGLLYISEVNSLKRVDSSGIIADLGITSLWYPIGMFGDTAGNVFIADTNNQVVRKYSSSVGTLTTIAGSGTPTGAFTANVFGCFVNTDGVVYVSETSSGKVCSLTAIDPTAAPTTTLAPSRAPTRAPTSKAPTRSPTYFPTGTTGNYQLTQNAATSSNVYGLWANTNGFIFVTRAVAGSCAVYKYSSSFAFTATYGTGTCASSGTSALTASFDMPRGIWGDSANNLFVMDSGAVAVRKINLNTLVVSVYAGTLYTSSTAATASNGDGGVATSATFTSPYMITGDTSGNVYVSDEDACKVRQISSSGIITTFAGTGACVFTTTTGPATSTTLRHAFGIWKDSNGVLYIAESNYLKKVDTVGIMSDLGVTALSYPYGMFGDTAGNLFIADSYTYVMRKFVTSTNILSTIAGFGSGTVTFTSEIHGAFVDTTGVVYFLELSYGSIDTLTPIDPTAAPTIIPSTTPSVAPTALSTAADTLSPTFAPTTRAPNSKAPTRGPTGYPTVASNSILKTHPTVSSTFGLWVDTVGSVYVSSGNGGVNCMVHKYDGSFALAASYGTEGSCETVGTSTSSMSFNNPYGMWAATDGRLFVAEMTVVRLISGDAVSVYAGAANGAGNGGDGGPASSAQVSSPYGVFGTTSGVLYIADSGNFKVRRVDASAIITTFAGTGVAQDSGDTGPATSIPFYAVNGVWVDTVGVVYVAEATIIKKVDAAGIMSPLITTGLTSLNAIYGDTAGYLYVADEFQRKSISLSSGDISVLAGLGTYGVPTNNAPATSIKIDFSYGIFVDTTGLLYFSSGASNVFCTVESATPSSAPVVASFPTIQPSAAPTIAPTFTPTNAPTATPTASPTAGPTVSPTFSPSRSPTNLPSIRPTAPTFMPSTSAPSALPTSTTGNYKLTRYSNGRTGTQSIWADSSGLIYVATGGSNNCYVSVYFPGVSLSTTYGSSSCLTAGDALTEASFNNPRGLWGDNADNVYVTETDSYIVRKLSTSTSVASVFAGTSGVAATQRTATNGDNSFATQALFMLPYCVTGDTNGNIFIGDYDGFKIRRVDSSGIIKTYAGTGVYGSSATSGPATSVDIGTVVSMWRNSAGMLYYSESIYLRRISSSGIYSDLGAGSFSSPFLYGDTGGNLFIANSASYVVKIAASNGAITTIAGSSTPTGSISESIYGCFVDSMGAVYFAESASGDVAVLTSMDPTAAPTKLPTRTPTLPPTVTPTTSAPSAIPTIGPSQAPTKTPTASPSAAPSLLPTAGPSITPSRLPSFSPSSTPTADPSYGPSRAPSASPTRSSGNYQIVESATISQSIDSIWGDSAGALYLTAGTSNFLFVYTAAALTLTATYGTGTAATTGTSLDAASFNYPCSTWGNTAGVLFVAERAGYVIRRVTSDGAVAVYAGTAGTASTSDTATNGDGGPATSATFFSPYGVTGDSSGNIFIADYLANKIRKVSSTGIISTYAGTGTAQSTTSSGPATSTTLNRPGALWMSSTGVLYIAEPQNLKSVSASGIVSNLLQSAFNSPYGMSGDAAGNVFVADTGYNVVWLYSVSSEAMLIIATGVFGSSGVYGGFVDGAGVVYVYAPGTQILYTLINIDPTAAPSYAHTSTPTRLPTVSPSTTVAPTITTVAPSFPPTRLPSIFPSADPSLLPSAIPTAAPSALPSTIPSVAPTMQHTDAPTVLPPSAAPSSLPSTKPTVGPSIVQGDPTTDPSIPPSAAPSHDPSKTPTSAPTTDPSHPPTSAPTQLPTVHPSVFPTAQSSVIPTANPSLSPTAEPTAAPSTLPSLLPSAIPSSDPSASPTYPPTAAPSTQQPSVLPTIDPTAEPSPSPTMQPTAAPSLSPSTVPSLLPSADPSVAPGDPSVSPTATPTSSPSATPTQFPSQLPSAAPTEEPSVLPSAIPSPVPMSASPTSSPSVSPTPIPSATPILAPSLSSTSAPSSEPTCGPSVSPTATLSLSPSAAPSVTPSATPSSAPSVAPSATPSSAPSVAPSATPSNAPSVAPSATPSSAPSVAPSATPSSAPSVAPSATPSSAPSATPSSAPSVAPSATPSSVPSVAPSATPSSVPSVAPSATPSSAPSAVPSSSPTLTPSALPSDAPSAVPSFMPTVLPTVAPTLAPTLAPTAVPSLAPTTPPTTPPTHVPSLPPSAVPSRAPSAAPSMCPSSQPSAQPSSRPSVQPSSQPSSQPSVQPSRRPTSQPSIEPTQQPSSQPSSQPTYQPTSKPSSQPTSQPSGSPTTQPSRQPSGQPTSQPTSQPFAKPSGQPSRQPTSQPTAQPTTVPRSSPTSQPTSVPTLAPVPTFFPTTHAPNFISDSPSLFPTAAPTKAPTLRPSIGPSAVPTAMPSLVPTFAPTSLLTLPLSSPISIRSLTDSARFRLMLPFYFGSVSSSYRLSNFTLCAPSLGSYFVLYGQTGQFINDTTSIMQATGIKGGAATCFDSSGLSMAVAGDVNKDSFADVILGMPISSAAVVLHGRASGFNDLADGFIVYGPSSSSAGWAVSGAGDINGDGIADMLIGAPYANNGRKYVAGAVYLVYGTQEARSEVFVSSMASNTGITLSGAKIAENCGISVSGAGDINKDGVADFALGCAASGSSFSGVVYIIYGSSSGSSGLSSIDLSTLTAAQGMAVYGQAYSWIGYSLAAAGDVNGDGFDDLVIGGFSYRVSFQSQQTYLIYGNASLVGSVTVSAAGFEGGAAVTGAGAIVGSAGDLNGDGLLDVYTINISPGRGGSLVVIDDLLSTPEPTLSPTARPTLVPTGAPTVAPSRPPTATPSIRPTAAPSTEPTLKPTGPTDAPTMEPTAPTDAPTAVPTAPTFKPSGQPSIAPTRVTDKPSIRPTAAPSELPTVAPSEYPTEAPTYEPSAEPSTVEPTFKPSRIRRPSVAPSAAPITEVVIQSGEAEVEVLQTANITYVVNVTGSVRLKGTSGPSSILMVLPTQNFTVVVERFKNTSDMIDLSHFTQVTSMDDLTITAGSAIITVTELHVIRLLNLQPEDISAANFNFYAPEKENIPPLASTYGVSQRSTGVTYALGSMLGLALLLGLCHIGRCYEVFKRRPTREELLEARKRKMEERVAYEKGLLKRRYLTIRKMSRIAPVSGESMSVSEKERPETIREKYGSSSSKLHDAEASDEEESLGSLNMSQLSVAMGDFSVALSNEYTSAQSYQRSSRSAMSDEDLEASREPSLMPVAQTHAEQKYFQQKMQQQQRELQRMREAKLAFSASQESSAEDDGMRIREAKRSLNKSRQPRQQQQQESAGEGKEAWSGDERVIDRRRTVAAPPKPSESIFRIHN